MLRALPLVAAIFLALAGSAAGDGVAHYGLLPDLLADTAQRSGRRALAPLFRSAEAYLRTWQRAFAR